MRADQSPQEFLQEARVEKPGHQALVTRVAVIQPPTHTLRRRPRGRLFCYFEITIL
jgi:hypothetical protein